MEMADAVQHCCDRIDVILKLVGGVAKHRGMNDMGCQFLPPKIDGHTATF
jgi:hypothetical protein